MSSFLLSIDLLLNLTQQIYQFYLDVLFKNDSHKTCDLAKLQLVEMYNIFIVYCDVHINLIIQTTYKCVLHVMVVLYDLY